MKILHLFTERPDGRKDWQWMTWRWEPQYQTLYDQIRTFRRIPVPAPDPNTYVTTTFTYPSTITIPPIYTGTGNDPDLWQNVTISTSDTNTITYQDLLANTKKHG